MDRRLIFPGIVATAWAQQTAPSEAEAALRARAEQFYNLEVDKKFRQAEAFVAEDTKDFFFNNGKPDMRKYHIDKVEIGPDGKSAKLTLTITSVMVAPSLGAMEFTAPSSATWKLENGEWLWYVKQETEIDTPFGKWKVNSGSSGAAPPLPAGMPDPAKMHSMVTIDRMAVELTAGSRKAETVTIANHMPGPIDVAVSGEVPKGLIVMVDKMKLATEEKAVVSFSAADDAAPAGSVRISAGPLQDFVIQVRTK